MSMEIGMPAFRHYTVCKLLPGPQCRDLMSLRVDYKASYAASLLTNTLSTQTWGGRIRGFADIWINHLILSLE